MVVVILSDKAGYSKIRNSANRAFFCSHCCCYCPIRPHSKKKKYDGKLFFCYCCCCCFALDLDYHSFHPLSSSNNNSKRNKCRYLAARFSKFIRLQKHYKSKKVKRGNTMYALKALRTLTTKLK